MVSDGGLGGRGGGRVGGAGSPSSRTRKLSAAEELERHRRASDAARIRGSYRYLHMASIRHVHSSSANRVSTVQASSSTGSPPRRSTYSEASSSTGLSRRCLTYNEASPPVPRFDPGYYAEDDDIPMLVAAMLTAGDFVPNSVLGTVTKLVEEQSRRAAGRNAEWLREQATQDVYYIVLDGSE